MNGRKIICSILMITGILTVSLFAEIKWVKIGLDSTVRCIGVDYQNRIIAGTDKGLYIGFVFSGFLQWAEIVKKPIKTLCAEDIFCGKKYMVCAAADSVGKISSAYLAWPTLKGPPFYEPQIIDSQFNAQTVYAVGDSADSIYAGYGNSVAKSVRYSNFTKFTVPENCFGGTHTRCAALYVLNSLLYGGGYATDINFSWVGGLVEQDSSTTMKLLRKIPVLSLQEGTSFTGPTLVVGSPDSIYEYVPKMNFHARSGTPEKEALIDLLAIPSTDHTIIAAAVKSGIYINITGNAWNKVGELPQQPLCMALGKSNGTNFPYSALFIGTVNGVYAIDTNTVSLQNNYMQKIDGISIRQTGKTDIAINYVMHKDAQIFMGIYDCSGKCIKVLTNGYISSGRYTFLWDRTGDGNNHLSRGLYILRISDDQNAITKKIYLLQ